MNITRVILVVVIVGLGFGTSAAVAQGQGVVGTASINQPPEQARDPALQVFDLDFPAAKITDLVQAVEKASKMPLNVLIPDLHRDFYIPSLKLRNVTVPQLFEAITRASAKSEARSTGPHNYTIANTSYGFRCSDARPTTNSIWYFFVDAPPQPLADANNEPICRFWQMDHYLQGLDLRIEDVTTAIETGWKMLGVNPVPKLNFHKDTRLLIVVGPPGQLAMVDDVLRQLTPRIDPVTGLPASGIPSKPTRSEGEKPSKR